MLSRLILSCFLLLTSVGGLLAQDAAAVMVHYMPWYASKPISGQWGWHWTMNHFNPDAVTEDGRREVASHDYPLIGAYDSNDPHVLECQVLLMKLAGVDGAIIDWYGIRDFRDYAHIHNNTQHLIKYLHRAGLKFAICYEDQSIKHMVTANEITGADAERHGREVLMWMDDAWFSHGSYFRIDGRPALLVFGPQHFDKSQWRRLLTDLPTKPALFVLPHLGDKSSADGVFGWAPVHGGKQLTPADWGKYLDDLYSRRMRGESVIAIAFPGFRDIYQQAGLHDSYGFIDARGGKTFTETLARATASGSPVIQIATWNDYGEGTMIEPTRSHGYRYLEALQDRSKSRSRVASRFQPRNLRLPVLLYRLRKQHLDDSMIQRQLDQAAELLFAFRCNDAHARLAGIQGDR